MEKRIFRDLVFVTISIACQSPSVFASSTNPFPPLPEGETALISHSGAAKEKNAFDWDEKIFSSGYLPGIELIHALDLNFVWPHGPETVSEQNLTDAHLASLISLKGLDSGYDHGMRQPEALEVDSSWGSSESNNKFYAANQFTVMPEPLGAAPFLLGGFAFSIREFFIQKP